MISKELREKYKQAAFRRDNAPRIAALPRGTKHWSWSAKPNKLTLHKRLYRKFGKASKHKCVDCGKKAQDWSNETGKYTDQLSDYKPRCRSCHVKKDKNWIKKTKNNAN